MKTFCSTLEYDLDLGTVVFDAHRLNHLGTPMLDTKKHPGLIPLETSFSGAPGEGLPCPQGQPAHVSFT